MPDESRQRIRRYEIVGPLDAGGMGQVFRAWDPSLRREVALKILRDEVAGDPACRYRLMEEARAAGGLNHPNILAVYDVGVEQDVAFIVTELIEGKNLRDEIARGRCRPSVCWTSACRWPPVSAPPTMRGSPTAMPTKGGTETDGRDLSP